jgi:hypothetical protein
MNISLGEFERRHNIAKGTVSKRAREKGFDTSQGLTLEAYEAMKAEFCVRDRPSADDNIPASPTYPMEPGHYADPFAGMTLGASGTMVPTGFQAQNRSLATAAAAQRVQQLCQGANLHAQQTVQAALESGDQMGQQLGAFLAERTIAAAESQRQQLIQQYLQAQGVQVDPKPLATPDGTAA